jgi:hypothetical protein
MTHETHGCVWAKMALPTTPCVATSCGNDKQTTTKVASSASSNGKAWTVTGIMLPYHRLSKNIENDEKDQKMSPTSSSSTNGIPAMRRGNQTTTSSRIHAGQHALRLSLTITPQQGNKDDSDNKEQLNISSIIDECAFISTHFPAQSLTELCRAVAMMIISPYSGGTTIFAPLPVTHVTVSLTLVRLAPPAMNSSSNNNMKLPTASCSLSSDTIQTNMERNAWGTVDILYENISGLYRLNIAPNRAIPLHIHAIMVLHQQIILISAFVCTLTSSILTTIG